MNINDCIVKLAYAVRDAVRPHLGTAQAKKSAGRTESGDEEFAIDEIAERAIEEFIDAHRLPVAYYSEGRGLVQSPNPQYLLIIDPIDGTRPAMVGLEGGVVSIAAAPYSLDACLRDVTFGCVLELKYDRLYTAEKGGTVRFMDQGIERHPRLTTITDLDHISWSFELAGRPVERVTRALGSLIDRSSIRGGVFVITGTAFSLTRLVSGQFDAVVDVGIRVLRDYPELLEEFNTAGLGAPLGAFPYDIAAAVLIAETAGCVVTDAYGNSLGPTPLLDTSASNISSVVAASNAELHSKLLAEIDRSIRGMRLP